MSLEKRIRSEWPFFEKKDKEGTIYHAGSNGCYATFTSESARDAWLKDIILQAYSREFESTKTWIETRLAKLAELRLWYATARPGDDYERDPVTDIWRIEESTLDAMLWFADQAKKV